MCPESFKLKVLSKSSRAKYISVEELKGFSRRSWASGKKSGSLGLISTIRGVLTFEEAIKRNLGGKLLCVIERIS